MGAVGSFSFGIIGLCISFLPIIIAVLRKNVYRRQVIIYQVILIGLEFCFSLVTGLLGFAFQSMVIVGIFGIISAIWSIFSLVAWIYILIHAIKDREMTILKKFGINI